MYLESLNWPAILASVVAYMVVGAIYYAPAVAGKAWMRMTGFNPETAGSTVPAMIKSAIAALILAILLAGLILRMGYGGWGPGALTGLIIAALVVGPASFPNYAFENKPTTLFLLHMGNTIIAMTAMGAIIGGWR